MENEGYKQRRNRSKAEKTYQIHASDDRFRRRHRLTTTLPPHQAL